MLNNSYILPLISLSIFYNTPLSIVSKINYISFTNITYQSYVSLFITLLLYFYFAAFLNYLINLLYDLLSYLITFYPLLYPLLCFLLDFLLSSYSILYQNYRSHTLSVIHVCIATLLNYLYVI